MNLSIEAFQQILSDILNKPVNVYSVKNLSGGCISQAVKADTSEGSFFIKYNSSGSLNLFETEKEGLAMLRNAGVVTVPEVFGIGTYDSIIYLVMEYIHSSDSKSDYWQRLGESLARLHLVSSSSYGLHFDNYIGSLPQPNGFSNSWIEFFIQHRLGYQIKMACDAGKAGNEIVKRMETLYKKLPDLLIEERPSLLHGDLWSGNVMVGTKGEPVLIDPAVYFGHREVELAFTTLFGGFDNEFYNNYMRHFPLEKGYEERFDIYNLYPLLVHVNLFGGGYINSVASILRKYL